MPLDWGAAMTGPALATTPRPRPASAASVRASGGLRRRESGWACKILRLLLHDAIGSNRPAAVLSDIVELTHQAVVPRAARADNHDEFCVRKTMAPPDQFTIGLVQMRCDLKPAVNLDRAEGHIREAARAGARLVCLPELFQSQYFCQRVDPNLFDLAEPIPGPSTERLGRVAKELGVVIVASLFEKRAAG